LAHTGDGVVNGLKLGSGWQWIGYGLGGDEGDRWLRLVGREGTLKDRRLGTVNSLFFGNDCSLFFVFTVSKLWVGWQQNLGCELAWD